MNSSLSRISPRVARSTICTQCSRSFTLPRSLKFNTFHQPSTTIIPRNLTRFFHNSQSRTFASKTPADDTVEQIQEQYATARDEFEIATEETEKKSVYAADDRAAAREELNNLKEIYERALEGSDADEVRRRVGQRIRELDNAVERLERSALED